MRNENTAGARERLEALLAQCLERDATDLHLSSGMPPRIRVHGQLARLEGAEAIAPEEVEAMARAIMNERQQEAFRGEQAVDLAFSSPGGGRFRVNVFRHRDGVGIALRRLEERPLSLEHWNLPETLGELAEVRDGLVIATGPTGSGKTTTLATLLDRIVRERDCHVITIEDPVEYLHASRRALVHQRELHTDAESFERALRAALREDPDVLLIGEMRDLETLRAALTAAETGHLVFSTLHTGDAPGSIERMVGMFPSNEKDAARHQLSMVLRAVIAQRLLRRRDGQGLVPAVELLRVNPAVANLIRTGRSQQLYSSMEAGAAAGMQTLAQALARRVVVGAVVVEEARKLARDTGTFEQWLRATRDRGHPGARDRDAAGARP